ncbi:MAG: nucleotidyl transferase AbiEii/AbiGii toxin family protein [Verrucomicrobiales bacterium]|nr:nucleotidyl transferase AbiEii/AbiGii toxin family protein [Verrucomicrobiales bacterium]
MPLTSFQSTVLKLLAENRTEQSHFAGGLLLNATLNSARFSHDFDIFHEVAEEVAEASSRDMESLKRAGYEVKPTVGDWENPTTFRKAHVSKGGESVEIDWAADSAFRFFPIEDDPLFGKRLHLFDMATNKALALSARSETRDLVDIVELDSIYPLEAVVWAACGKDEGFSPLLLVEMMRRFARISRATLMEIQARQLDPVELKKAWIEMSDRADAEITKLADTRPEIPIGVAFVDATGTPGWIGKDPNLRIHAPSIRGCLPSVTQA